MLRGNIGNDDTGCKVVFAEHGASASHMTAATVPDTISHLPGMVGEANDAVSAHTGQNEGHSHIAQGSGDGMLHDLGVRLLRNRRAANWGKVNDSVDPVKSNVFGHPSAGLLWERTLEDISLQVNSGKV